MNWAEAARKDALSLKGKDWGSADPFSIDLGEEEIDIEDDLMDEEVEDEEGGENGVAKRDDLRTTLHARRLLVSRFAPKSGRICEDAVSKKRKKGQGKGKGQNQPPVPQTGFVLESFKYPQPVDNLVVSVR